MKKKILTMLITILALCTCTFTLTACGENEPPHTHNYVALKHDTTNHWYECSCGDKINIENHKGGTATCKDKANCLVCEEEYGEIGYCYYTNGTCIWCGTTVSEGLEYKLINNDAEYEVSSKGTCYDKNIVIIHIAPICKIEKQKEYEVKLWQMTFYV